MNKLFASQSMVILCGAVVWCALLVAAQDKADGTWKAPYAPVTLSWEDVAGYWQDVNGVNLADARIGQAQDDKRKAQEKLNVRIQSFQAKCAAMVPAKIITGASEEQAVELKVPKETPICVAPPKPTEPDLRSPSQKTATHSTPNGKSEAEPSQPPKSGQR